MTFQAGNYTQLSAADSKVPQWVTGHSCTPVDVQDLVHQRSLLKLQYKAAEDRTSVDIPLPVTAPKFQRQRQLSMRKAVGSGDTVFQRTTKRARTDVATKRFAVSARSSSQVSRNL